jgi:hypothetical protein
LSLASSGSIFKIAFASKLAQECKDKPSVAENSKKESYRSGNNSSGRGPVGKIFMKHT